MATNFPASLDTLTNPTSSDSLSSPSHSAQHANANDAIEALQAKVGADSSAVTSSHDYKIAALEGQGAWTAYTPTTFGLTIGNGTLTGRYAQVNGLVFFNVSFVMGSTSAVTGDVAFGLPVTRVNTGEGCATGFYTDTGTSYSIPAVADMGTTSVSLRVMNASSTYIFTSLISATVPFTWANTDLMSVAGFYEAA